MTAPETEDEARLRTELLQGIEICDDEWQRFFADTHLVNIEKEDHLFRQGHPVGCVYYLRQGHGEIADALDEAERTKKSAARVERSAAEAQDRLTASRAAVDKAVAEGVEGGDLAKLQKELTEAEQAAQRLTRRLAGIKVKAEAAESEARKLTGEPSVEDEAAAEESYDPLAS